jgi:type II secretory pathway pseudopilin PulG
MIEMLVVIAVMGILVAAAAPIVVQQVDQQRIADTRDAIVRINQGLWGTRESPGFVGELGQLPAALADLTTQGAQPAGTIATQNGVRMGWTGPYVDLGFNAASALLDRWGTPYLFSTGGGLLAGQIRSQGPDRINGTADDLTYPTTALVATGTLMVNLDVWHVGGGAYATNPSYAADTAQSTSVTVYYSNAGVQATRVQTTSAGSSPPFTFLGLHRGNHAVVVSSTFKGASPALTTSVVVFVEGNGSQTAVDLYLGGPG